MFRTAVFVFFVSLSSAAFAVKFHFGFTDLQDHYVIFSDKGVLWGNSNILVGLTIVGQIPQRGKIAQNGDSYIYFEDSRLPEGEPGVIHKRPHDLNVHKTGTELVAFSEMGPQAVAELQSLYDKGLIEVVLNPWRQKEYLYRIGDMILYLRFEPGVSEREQYTLAVSKAGKPFTPISNINWFSYGANDVMRFFFDGELISIKLEGRLPGEATSTRVTPKWSGPKRQINKWLPVSPLRITALDSNTPAPPFLPQVSTPLDIFIRNCEHDLEVK